MEAMHAPTALRRLADDAEAVAAGARGALRTGLLRPTSPTKALEVASAVRRWGTGPAIGFSLGSARHPDSVAVIDLDESDRPEMSFAEMDHRCDALALALLDRGIGPGSAVGLLGRNSRAYLQSIIAVARAGADVVYLNTSSEREQIEEIAEANGIGLVIHDVEFESALPAGMPTLQTDEASGIPLISALPMDRPVPTPHTASQHVIMTSGTSSGRPRGAGRSGATIAGTAALLDVFPLKMGATVVFGAPLFHSWGWMNHRLATLLDCTQVVMRRPRPERLLAALEATDATALVTVPVVLRWLVDLPSRVKRRYRLEALQCVSVSGAALPGTLATEFMDDFGDVLFNLYGSTEAGFATCATPADLRVDPTSAGRPLAGVHVEVLDRQGRGVRGGTEGRVFVSGSETFHGYTDGTDRPRVRGMVFTGDIGRMDPQRRLTVVGRADDVIVTGGENVHPAEIENILRRYAGLAEVAVAGRPDPVYGAILVAHVVPTDVYRFDPEELLAWCREHLGPHLRPRAVVVHSALPRNATGKLLRRVLAGGQPTEADPADEAD